MRDERTELAKTMMAIVGINHPWGVGENCAGPQTERNDATRGKWLLSAIPKPHPVVAFAKTLTTQRAARRSLVVDRSLPPRARSARGALQVFDFRGRSRPGF